jgi:hypothetical protein
VSARQPTDRLKPGSSVRRVAGNVIGGQERWRRRIEGLANELRLQIAELSDEDESRAATITRTLEDLEAFAGSDNFGVSETSASFQSGSLRCLHDSRKNRDAACLKALHASENVAVKLASAIFRAADGRGENKGSEVEPFGQLGDLLVISAGDIGALDQERVAFGKLADLALSASGLPSAHRLQFINGVGVRLGARCQVSLLADGRRCPSIRKISEEIAQLQRLMPHKRAKACLELIAKLKSQRSRKTQPCMSEITRMPRSSSADDLDFHGLIDLQGIAGKILAVPLLANSSRWLLCGS